MILDDIIKNKREEVAKIAMVDAVETCHGMSLRQNSPVSFRQALLRSDKIKLIAEIKKQSPSAGIIRADFDPAELAKTYEKAGASAISVLTDQKFFGGSIEDLKKVKAACSLPVIQKDFIIDEKQIHQAKAAGADAILLIVKVLGLEKTIEFLKITRELGMDALVETHNSDEVEFAFMAGAEIIGVNNRDLKVFRVDFKNTLNLINKYPDLKDRILVSESGIKHTKHVKQLHQAGVSAILVGESLLRAKDIAAKIAELLEN